MDQTHSELPSDGLRLIDALRRAINDNPQQAAGVLTQDAQLRDELKRFLELIPASAPADPTPLCTVVDNSTSDLMEQVRESFAECLALFETAKQPPRDDMHTAVDNSTSDLMEQVRESLAEFLALFETAKQPQRDDIRTAVDNSIIPNDVHDPNVAESHCSAGTVVPPPFASRLA